MSRRAEGDKAREHANRSLLAIGSPRQPVEIETKIGVFSGSVICAVAGVAWLRLATDPVEQSAPKAKAIPR